MKRERDLTSVGQRIDILGRLERRRNCTIRCLRNLLYYPTHVLLVFDRSR
jgi:hypothetical protein